MESGDCDRFVRWRLEAMCAAEAWCFLLFGYEVWRLPIPVQVKFKFSAPDGIRRFDKVATGC